MGNFNDRQKDFPWMGQQNITLIGVGGIGSWVAFLLARIGHRLTIYDGDTVEMHNLGGQLFRHTDIESLKTDALLSILRDFCEPAPHLTLGRFSKGMPVSEITILGLDNMKTRKEAVEKWLETVEAKREDHKKNGTKSKVPYILIDGRLEGEQGIIYALDSKKDYDAWMKEWFPDDAIGDGFCTMRATSYNGVLIAAIMIAILNNKLANFYAGDSIRDVPYKIEYGLPAFIFDTYQS